MWRITFVHKFYNLMSFSKEIKKIGQKAVRALWEQEVDIDTLHVNETKPEFEGEYTLVTFSLAKIARKKPAEIAEEIGQWIHAHYTNIFRSYNVINGFLNLSLTDEFILDFVTKNIDTLVNNNQKSGKIMVEFSSPNTNKPLHFGHLRNNFLGDSVSRIYAAYGFDVCKANLINDRGIHICKSMIAWQKLAEGATPDSTGVKGDHFVGAYYVKFNDLYKEEIKQLVEGGLEEKEAERQAPIFIEAQEMLRKWEAGDEEIVALWKKMNGWVYNGFDKTYNQLGISFDRFYYESETYLLGKKNVDEGLEKEIFFKKEDGSVWIDMEDEGLDEKLVLRSDGTSVYITQDIGTADLKYEQEAMQKSVYVIADEQNYHMKVLKIILARLGRSYANGVHHLSYGMVELPHGKMKSREGTVVDADDMIDEMLGIAQKNTEELGKVDGFSAQELNELYRTIGLGALKFYLLRVDPKKKMIFNPEESIDFHGFTGPFVQYTHARLCSILRKAGTMSSDISSDLNDGERVMITELEKFSAIIEQAALEYNPSLICNYVYHIAKNMNSFLNQHKILTAETAEKKALRLAIATITKKTIAEGLSLLGIQAPERM